MRRPLVATYRVQLSSRFTFQDVRARLAYLERLGISHLYCSPILAARTGSTHGYDVTDPTQISAALGGEEAFVALVSEAHGRGMGIVLDIVPNHMGICADNPYWEDVLRYGRQSRYAGWFDVSWRSTQRDLHGKVLLPILGDTLERVVERGEITLDLSGAEPRVRYFNYSFPLNEHTLPRDLRSSSATGDAAPKRLMKLLGRQYYKLAFWKAAQRDLNYRRFFDVNELVSLRVEREDVFVATHRVVLDLVSRGLVDALRVDHIDGLLEPTRYLERLRAGVGPDVPILVEKILAYGEALPHAWPVDGTTGYEFLTAVDDVLIEPAGFDRIARAYGGESFEEIAVNAKRRVLRTTMNPDVRRLAPLLHGLGEIEGETRPPIAAYAHAIIEFVAALPVYRTYIDSERPAAHGFDREVIEATLTRIRAQFPQNHAAFTALARVLLGEGPHFVIPSEARDPYFQGQERTYGSLAEPVLRSASDVGLGTTMYEERLRFVLRLQQLSGPAAAKGVEDTALYSHAPLASRSEVGGDPGAPLADSHTRMHTLFAERQRSGPLSLNATTTHDTKRSADARSRLDALSEHANEWLQNSRRWARHHRSAQRHVNGRRVPSARTQDFLYQSLIAIWPPGDDAAEFRERLSAYALKAIREAKVSTTWTDPDVEYEAGVRAFIDTILDEKNETFLREIDGFVAMLTGAARRNMLVRTVLQHTTPGVPDIYQGDELWYTALVDPDNRRDVDWDRRERALADIAGTELRSEGVGPGVLKLACIERLLAFRQSHQALLSGGSYEPLDVMGEHSQNVFAFRRRHGTQDLIVVVALHTSRLGTAWGDTRVSVGSDAHGWRCELREAGVEARGGDLVLRDVLAESPAAVLSRCSDRGCT